MAPISRKVLLGLLILQIFYVLGFMLWYSQTALGLNPVLDGAETIALAQDLIEGSLEREPFYRAMLYPALLAAFGWITPDTASLALLARLINAFALITGSWVVFYLAHTIWKSTGAGLIAWALTGLNPVLLHFAADPIDITVAVTLFLLALLALWLALTRDKNHLHILSGVFAGLTVLTRPQFIFPAIALPFLVLIVQYITSSRYRRAAMAFLSLSLGLVFILCLQGVCNLLISGQWAILPTQGAFNLWAANEPDAHGRYFVQTVALTKADPGLNPTRREAEIRYQRETGLNPGADPRAMDRYWNKRTVDRILQDPVSWLKQLAWKGYFLLHPHEQYNNKTYSVHKELSPWLRWNPLYWSVVLALGCAGFIFGKRPPFTWILIGCIFTYVGALLLTFVSARFRIPLVPLLAILSGGLATLRLLDLACHPRRVACTSLLILFIFATGLTSWNQVRDPITRAEDYLLIAQSSHELGWEADTYHWAAQSLAVNPARGAARELILLSHFNLLLNGEPAPSPEQTASLISTGEHPLPPTLAFPWGTIWWHAGQREQAMGIWQQALEEVEVPDPQIIAALMFAQPDHRAVQAYLTLHPKVDWPETILAAAALNGDVEAGNLLANRLPPDQVEQVRESLRRLFLPRSGAPAISTP